LSYSKIETNENPPACYWHKNRHEDQWNRIEDPDTSPHSYSHLFFDKGTQNMYWRKTVFSINGTGKTGYLPEKIETRYQSPFARESIQRESKILM
jgi:hypothetical protein